MATGPLAILIRYLPLAVGVVPLTAVSVAHWLGVEAGQLPGCIPYVDGCVSISATGRTAPGSFIFKPVYLAFGLVLTAIWSLVVDWSSAFPRPPTQNRTRMILGFGIAGALALMVYTSLLGTSGPFYEFMRRFGIYVFFVGTVVAQLLTRLALPTGTLRRWMLLVVSLPFVLGALNLVLKYLLDDANAAENRIEWIVSLAMQAWFVLLHVAWRQTGFPGAATTGSTSAHR